MKFNDNPEYERLVNELNDLLKPLGKQEATDCEQPSAYPLILKLGSSRSGSTLFTQWVASLGVFAYPSNFLSLFYKAPSIGARVYELLTNEKLKYNNEFTDINQKVDFTSVSGKTQGLKSPNEFWSFWLQHFEFPRVPVSEGEFLKTADFSGFNREIKQMHQVFNKPFMIKAHNINYYVKAFSENIENAVYVHMHRNPVHVVNSVIKARVTRWGDINYWFGWKPKEIDSIKDMDVYHQVAGQVYFNERAILGGKRYLGDRYISFSYNCFCEDPHKIYDMMTRKVNEYSKTPINESYKGPKDFSPSSKVSEQEQYKIEAALSYFMDKYGPLEYS